MKRVDSSTRFRKEYKLAVKRGKDINKLKHIIDLLTCDAALPERCRPHKLSGNYAGMWECHIEPDWLLIYEITKDELQLFRLGSHSDLFE